MPAIPEKIVYVNFCTYISPNKIQHYKNHIMQITTVSDFRKNIKTYLNRVVKNFETLIINRLKDSGIVVMSFRNTTL